MKPLSPLEAYHEIMAFASERGENALNLALHAALPQTFRPSFLHLLRLNFVPEALDEPWIEADVLFAPFCEHLGGGYYRFDARTRWLLLENLAANFPSQNPSRLQRVANLLAAWLDTLERSPSHSGDAVARDYISVERWGALAYLHPDAAAAQLARALEASLEGDRAAARLRLGSLMSSLASPLAGHAHLLTYAAGLQALEEGRTGDARQILDTLPDSPIHVAGATLRSPRMVAGSRPVQPAAEPVRLAGVQSVAIVVSQAEPFGITLNADCEFFNPRPEPAILERLEARLDDPRGQSFPLGWSLVYQGRSLQRQTGGPGGLSLPPRERFEVGIQFKAGHAARRYEWSAGNHGFRVQAWTRSAGGLPSEIYGAYEIQVTPANAQELRRWSRATVREWSALGDPDNAVGIAVAIRPRQKGLVVLVRREKPMPMQDWFRGELEERGYQVDERPAGAALAGVPPRFLVIDLRESLSRQESLALLANPQIPVIVPAGPAEAPWHIRLNEMNIVQGIDEAEKYLAQPPADVAAARSRLLARWGALPVEEFEKAAGFEQRKEMVHRVQFELERGERTFSAAEASNMATSQWALERIACYLVWEREPPADVYVQRLAVEREANWASGASEASLMPLHYAVRALRRHAEKEPQAFADPSFARLAGDVEAVLASRPSGTGREIRENLDFIRRVAPPPEYRYDVYVAYARADRELAMRLQKECEARGFQLFLDRDVQPAGPWLEQLREAIAWSRMMLLILSPASARSEDVLREANWARERSIPILPFLVEDFQPPEGFLPDYLERIHWFRASSGPFEETMYRLAAAMREILNRQSPSGPRSAGA